MFFIKMLSCRNFLLSHVQKILRRTDQMKLGKFQPKNFILVNAFFEPSTRTSLSFASAAYRLGGNVITFNKDVSSVKKGESFEDTIQTLSLYGDVMVVRHPEKSAVEHASEVSHIPVINAGDGDGEHPTQALLDMYTIREFLQNNHFHHPLVYLNHSHAVNNYDAYNILLVGDVLHSRTIHSLLHLLYMFPPINVFLLPYEGCDPSEEMIDHITENNHDEGLKEIVLTKDSVEWNKFQVVYVTRFQKERHEEAQKPNIILDKSVYKQLQTNCIVMHPLPRNEELPCEIDHDERSHFIQQMENGVYTRMAILDMFLDDLSYSEQPSVDVEIIETD